MIEWIDKICDRVGLIRRDQRNRSVPRKNRMLHDREHDRIAEAAVRAAHAAKLDVQVAVLDDVAVLVGPPTVPKGQATESVPPVEDRRRVVLLDTNYLIALYPGRYVVFQRDAEGRWLRRKTRKGDSYKSLRQALVDVFAGITWDRIKPIKEDLLGVDREVLGRPNSQGKSRTSASATVKDPQHGAGVVEDAVRRDEDRIDAPAEPPIPPASISHARAGAPAESRPEGGRPNEAALPSASVLSHVGSAEPAEIRPEEGRWEAAAPRRRLGVPDLPALPTTQLPKRRAPRSKRS